MKNSIELLEAVKNTLNTIPVSGIENADKLIGCYRVIDTVIKQIKEEAKTEKEE